MAIIRNPLLALSLDFWFVANLFEPIATFVSAIDYLRVITDLIAFFVHQRILYHVCNDIDVGTKTKILFKR